MSVVYRNILVVGVFLSVALAGIALSLSAPYIQSDDEIVYLTGALQEKERNLPDAYMLQAYAYGPYLYPYILSEWYELLGHETFKTISVVVLVLLTGLGAYALFRTLGLPWVAALLFSVIVLMPRLSAGTEFFGILTFNEAIGRSFALPLFFFGSLFVIKRMMDKSPLWPVFGVFGLLMFLHPVTIMLFSAVCLIGVLGTRLIEKEPVVASLREAIVSGVVFVAAGSYFFVEVISRLLRSVGAETVSASAYVDAVLFRNAWEFPLETLSWYRHMGIVSLAFLIFLLAFFVLPQLRAIRARYVLSHARLIYIWGGVVAVASLLIALILPGLNLYFMEHMNVSYVFQQWSRISKFYYLGLFVALVPAVYVLWRWFEEKKTIGRRLVCAGLVLIGIGSSSVAFEMAQFAVGYKNFQSAYIPQTLSHVVDDVSPSDYTEVCSALAALGATAEDSIMSGDFALRYYCRSNLYVTNEEGAAYFQLGRADLVAWHESYLAQRAALTSGDPETVRQLARKVGATFVVVRRLTQYTFTEKLPASETMITARHVIYKIPQI